MNNKRNKYVIISTFCNNEEIAKKIINTLLEKKLVAGSQISKVYSKYWWNNELEETEEFKIQFRTKENLFNDIKLEIKKIHDYDIAEISCIEIINGNEEFFDWIEKNTI